MEKAVYFHTGFDKEKIKNVDLKKFERIYYGSEFCDRKIFLKNEIEIIFRLIDKFKLKFSLLTPPTTDRHFHQIKKAIDLISEKYSGKEGFEVIVNDLGVLNFINKSAASRQKIEIVAGRIIGKNIISQLYSCINHPEIYKRYFEFINILAKCFGYFFYSA